MNAFRTTTPGLKVASEYFLQLVAIIMHSSDVGCVDKVNALTNKRQNAFADEDLTFACEYVLRGVAGIMHSDLGCVAKVNALAKVLSFKFIQFRAVLAR
jgi:hypothetical protein